MRVLFLENQDSFSWNVIDALPVNRNDITIVSGNPPQAAGHEKVSDSIASHVELQAEPVEASSPPRNNGPFDKLRVKTVITKENPSQLDMTFSLHQFNCLVIGPGPTDPFRAGLIDIVQQAAALSLPILGICLGHQAIGLAFGARLVRTHPVHGKRSEIVFSKSRLFPRTLGTHTVMRYHSLSLSDVKSPLRVVAQSADSIPMAIEHESLPIAGLQFHPDSYATEQGRAMLADFFEAIQ